MPPIRPSAGSWVSRHRIRKGFASQRAVLLSPAGQDSENLDSPVTRIVVSRIWGPSSPMGFEAAIATPGQHASASHGLRNSRINRR
jgi:hypothetical protein